MSQVATNFPAGHFREGSVDVSSSSAASPVRRLAITRDRLVTRPLDSAICTIPDVVAHAVCTYGDNKNAFGWRDILRVVVVEEEEEAEADVVKKKKKQKQWKRFELSAEYRFLTHSQVQAAISEISAALVVSLGISRGQVLNIYAQTSSNWQLVSLACASVAITVATAYDTLGDAGLRHSIDEPEAVAIFTNADLLPRLLRVLRDDDGAKTLRVVIYDRGGELADPPELKQLLRDLQAVRPDSLTVLSIDDLRAMGRRESMDNVIKEERRPTKDDLALIMYTSGSTGPPKGVRITHANVVASLGGVSALLGHHFSASSDSYLAYLPLAHVLEFIVELTMLFHGVVIGYGRPRTLMDNNSLVGGCRGDLVTFNPSIIVGVPAIWEGIRKSLLSQLDKASSIQRAVFWGAMFLKRKEVPVLGHLANSLVLSRVRDLALGGGDKSRLRLAMSGGAPLSSSTQDLLSTALVPIVQGYGMTETCGMCAILPPELYRPYHHSNNSVGLPVPSVEIKLMDVPEMGYFARGKNHPSLADSEAGSDSPRREGGEVCVRGPSVTGGYFKRDDLNEDEGVFVSSSDDGGGKWLRTGDVGRWREEDGTLEIIDRVKNLVKLENGEYISLERLEATYKTCALVSNVCVYVTSGQRLIGIIAVHFENLKARLGESADSAKKIIVLTPESIPSVYTDPSVLKLVRDECNNTTQAGKKKWEQLSEVVLCFEPEEWTAENGYLTGAGKVKRGEIIRRWGAGAGLRG